MKINWFPSIPVILFVVWWPFCVMLLVFELCVFDLPKMVLSLIKRLLTAPNPKKDKKKEDETEIVNK